MAEGEMPDYLKESVPSAEVFEQDARREYQIAAKAWELRVPRESMKNPTVRHYVSVLRDLEAAYERIQLDKVGAPLPVLENAERLDFQTQANVVYMATEMLLLDGLPGRDLDRSQLKHWFDGLARRYGARVEYDRHAPTVEPVPPADGLWTGRSAAEPAPRPSWPPQTDRSWWLQPDRAYELHGREHLAALTEEAARHGMRADVARTDPELHTTLTRLVHARQLAADTAITSLPPAPGLTPSAQERLSQVAMPLTRLAVAMLEEQFRPGQLPPSQVTGELHTVGQRYGLKIA